MPNVPLQYAPWFWKATGAGTDADPLVPTVNVGTVTTTGGVAGDVAHDAVDSGNPVKIGGKANSSAPTSVAAGDRVDGWYSLAGAAVVVPHVGTANDGDPANCKNLFGFDGGTLLLNVCPKLFNGSTHDRPRSNHEATAFASAARTASSNSSDLTNYNARGVRVVIDCTAVTDTPSVVFTIAGKCTLSGKYTAILASAAITGTGTTTLVVYPGVTAAANVSVSDVIPRLWRVEAVHADADSITYSVSVNYIV